ncbi:FAD dependent oxidoreductase protein [Rutstroemia sp. NJR-2017a WRK4]|nr:FAD dependent oxidoreductase protein [Rutstroemia sp. NJR-2017a WRK4]
MSTMKIPTMKERADVEVTLPVKGAGRSFWMDDYKSGGADKDKEQKQNSIGMAEGNERDKIEREDGDKGDGEEEGKENEEDRKENDKEKREEKLLPGSADIVVVGSGISGAGVVWELMFGEGREGGGERKGEKIVMLEARGVCEGATGRNGGHLKAASYRSFPYHKKVYGVQEAVRIARFEYENILRVYGLCKEWGVGCAGWLGETVDLFFEGDEGDGNGDGDAGVEGDTEWDEAKKGVRELWRGFEEVESRNGDKGEGNKGEREKGGIQWYEFFEAEEAREKFQVTEGKRKLLGALRYMAGSISAYKFVRGVLGLCLREGREREKGGGGFEIFEGREVVSVEREGEGGDGYTVRTADGEVIKAKHVVLATNGYTGFLRKEFQGVIVPLRGQVTGQRFVSGREAYNNREAKAEAPRNRTYSFIYPGGFDYLVPFPTGLETGDGKEKKQQTYILGGGLSFAPGSGISEFGELNDGEVDRDVSTYLRSCLGDVFGGQGIWRTEKEWTGIMGYSADGMPFVGKVDGGGEEKMGSEGEGKQGGDGMRGEDKGRDGNRGVGIRGEGKDEGGLWITASFQGHGMVLAWGCAREVVRGIRGLESQGEGKSGFPEVYRMRRERLGRRFQGFVE